jgi:hypothetical protein
LSKNGYDDPSPNRVIAVVAVVVVVVETNAALVIVLTKVTGARPFVKGLPPA